jgi:hypothetical protein
MIAPLLARVGDVLAINHESAVANASLDRHPEGQGVARQHAPVKGLDAVAANRQWRTFWKRGEHSVGCYRGHHEGQVARIRTVHKALHDTDRRSIDSGGRLGGQRRGTTE